MPHVFVSLSYSIVIPENQDTELMGFFMFCGQVLTWVPSVVFTVLNEADVSQRIGLASLNVMLICSLIAYLKMGSYSDAIAVANRLQLETLQSPDKPTTIRDDEKTDKNIIAINSSES